MKRYAGAVLVMAAVAVGWVVVLPPAAVRQPMAFPHARHKTVACTVCHRGAQSEVRAGIPDTTLCSKCHATAPAGTSAVWESSVARKAIAWVQVTHVPEHVLFSHRRHGPLAGLDCTSCHGAMRDRSVPPGVTPIRLNMTTCLSCHHREGAAEDCAACHR